MTYRYRSDGLESHVDSIRPVQRLTRATRGVEKLQKLARSGEVEPETEEV